MPELTLDQALAELPDTADGIADRMRALDIKGRRQDDFCCPIANWLIGKGFEDPMVGEEWCEALDDDPTQTDTPPAVAEFVRRFDAGVYLDLVETETSGVTQ
jgi:hypothetical protein